MIVWLIIFLIIVLVSFILALRSMRDYHELPMHFQSTYSLFLIKNENGLTEDIFKWISEAVGKKKLIISFERLFKGSKKALVVYGPVNILEKLDKELNLTELEDYSFKKIHGLENEMLAWEVSSKYFQKNTGEDQLCFSNITNDLSDYEELWWQLVLQPRSHKDELQPMFKAIIRVAVLTGEKQKTNNIKQKLEKYVKESGLIALPQAYSSTQVLEFYQQRSLPQKTLAKEEGHFMISSQEVKYLLC